MIAVVYKGIGCMAVEDVPTPAIQDGDLLVKVKACAICGGDLRTFHHGHAAIKPPIILGHEFAGEIVAAGKKVQQYAAGDRVIVAPGIGCGHCSYCLSGNQHLCYHRLTLGHQYHGGFAEFVRIPAIAVQAGNVNLIPASVDYLSATLAEPLACVINGQEAMQIRLGDTVAVIGAGPIGIMHAELARSRGAGKVFLINRSMPRLDRARSLGYDAYISSQQGDAVQQVLELTGGMGANVVIVTAGSEAAMQMGLAMTGKMGKVCFFAGLPKDKPQVTIDANFLHYRQITVYGTFSSAPRHNALAIEMIRSGKLNVDYLLTHAVSLQHINKGLELVEKQAGMRVAVVPHWEEAAADIAKHPQMVIVKQ